MNRFVIALCLLLTAFSLHAQDCAVRVGAVRRCLAFTRIDADGPEDIALSGTVLFDVPGDPGRVSLANRAAPVRFPDSITTGNISHHKVAASARVVVTEQTTLNPPSTSVSINRVNGTNSPIHA